MTQQNKKRIYGREKAQTNLLQKRKEKEKEKKKKMKKKFMKLIKRETL